MVSRLFNKKVKVNLFKVKFLKHEQHFSGGQLVVFGFIFAAIGSYFIYNSLAANLSNTFGKTNIGASCDTFVSDLKRVNEYSVGSSATVSQLSIYLKPSSTSGTQ